MMKQAFELAARISSRRFAQEKNMIRSRRHGLTTFSRIRPLLMLTAVSLIPSSTFAQSYAFVANRCSSDVSVIDVATRAVVGTTAVPARPQGVAITPNGAFAWVVSDDASQIWVLNTTNRAVVDTINLGAAAAAANLRAIAFTPDGAAAYVPRANTVAVVDTATRTVVATIPMIGSTEGIAMSPNRALAYVALRTTPIGEGGVAVIDTTLLTVVANIDLGFTKLGPTDLAVTPTGERVYVANQNWNVKVLDATTNSVIATLPTFIDPFGVAITPNGGSVYITDFFGPIVLVFDTASNTLVTTIPLASRPRDIAITADGTLAFVPGEFNTSPSGNEVSVIDIGSNAVIQTIPVGLCPYAVAMTPDQSVNGRLTRFITFIRSIMADGGLEQSLVASLSAALDAYEHENLRAACSALTAFIHHVQAQSGKKISTQTATQLIATTDSIKAALGCR